MKVVALLSGIAIALWPLGAGGTTADDDEDGVRRLPSPGASWTRERQPHASFIAPAAHLDMDAQLDFYSGFSFFRSPWVAAPASTTARDGLGPLFNAHSCDGCHRNGGRGRSLLDDADSPATVVRVSVSGANGAAMPHPRFGSQLQTRATFRGADGAPGAEAAVTLTAEETPQGLRQPTLRVVPRQTAPDAQGLMLSARVAPALLGLGLLEAIPEADLLARADPHDRDGDGISGRPNRTADGRLGRFGWKAHRATVAEQTAAAFSEDIGITSSRFPHGPCTARQEACGAQPDGNGPEGVEMPDALFALVVHFTAHIPPPAAGRATERVRRGQQTFTALGCGGCHTPRHDTAAGTVWPYTDLLLHDMGDGLADHRPEGQATGAEWRTPPLWGLGAQRAVSGHTTLLHDGRARDADEAIRWHGGEAETARLAYEALNEAERKALLAFLNAI